MAELCLVASHGYPPGPGKEQSLSKFSKDYPSFLTRICTNLDLLKPSSFNIRLQQNEDSLKSWKALLEGDHISRIANRRPPLIFDVQDALTKSVIFGRGIVEKCAKYEEIMKFLMSGCNEAERGRLHLSLPFELIELQACGKDVLPLAPYPSSSFYDADSHQSLVCPDGSVLSQKPLVDSEVYFSCASETTYLPDKLLSLSGSGTLTEMKDILSVISEFYLTNNSIKCGERAMVVPYFNRRLCREKRANIQDVSSVPVTVKDLSLRSSDKTKHKTSARKRSNKTANKENSYGTNYLHACEGLLSMMVNKKRDCKSAIQSLRKAGPELPQLLTQFSAGIAGTGLAVLLSVVCKLACGRVSLSASKILSTGLGLGLVWLSWAVNRLRDTVIAISKSPRKLDTHDEEMMANLDRNMREIYLRTIALMAVAVLKLA